MASAAGPASNMRPTRFPRCKGGVFGYTVGYGGASRGAPEIERGHHMRTLFLAVALLLAALPARAGQADVLKVEAAPEAGGSWRFDVTVAHADEGWSHYADRWEVVAPDGRLLASRVLMHPHVREQPFTRSLGGVVIPAGVTSVIIRAHDKEHGLGGAEITVELKR